MALTLVPFNSTTTDRRTAGLLNALTREESRIKIAGEQNSMYAPTLELEKVKTAAAGDAPAMMTVEKARQMIARVDDAETQGVELTDDNMSDYGYVKTQGGAWELPIPTNILRQL